MKLHAFLMLLVPCVALLDEQIIRRALRRAGIAMDKTQHYTGVDPRLFERRLKGEGFMRHNDLLKLSLEYWQWATVYQYEAYGPPADLERAIALDEVSCCHKRMAKVELVHDERKDRTA